MNFSARNFLYRTVSMRDKLGPFLVRYYGLGVKRARILCFSFGLPYTCLVRTINSSRLANIESVVLFKFGRENDIKRQVLSNQYKKYQLGGWVGLRLSQGLPAYGQRTKTNASTAGKLKPDFSKV